MRKLWIVCRAASLCMGGCAGQNTDGQDEVDTTSVSFMAEETAEYIEQGGIVIEEGFRSNEESATEETGQTQENLLQEEADIPQEAEIPNNTAEETESAAQEVSPEPLKGETDPLRSRQPGTDRPLSDGTDHAFPKPVYEDPMVYGRRVSGPDPVSFCSYQMKYGKQELPCIRYSSRNPPWIFNRKG